MTTTAQQVNSKLKQERNATLLDLAESELQISGKNVPSLSKEVNSKQVQKIDDVMTPLFGVEWFKQRKTHQNSICSNLELICSISTVFYLTSAPMLELVEKELKKSLPETTESGIVVDGRIMEEFLLSADLVRDAAWQNASSLYSKARDRLQRNVRAKRHRRKVKSGKLFGGGDESGSEGSGSKTSGKGDEEGSQYSNEVVQAVGRSANSKLAPLKSTKECLQDVLDAVKFLNSDEIQNSKFDRLAQLFNKLSLPLERRMGTSGVGNEIQICMIIAIMILVEEILPVSMSQKARLDAILDEYSLQSVFACKAPRSMDAQLGVRLEKVLKSQAEVLVGLVKRWFPKLSDSQASLSKAEMRSLQSHAAEISDLFQCFEKSLGLGVLTRDDVVWILTSLCHYYVRLSVLAWTNHRSSSFIRAGQLVTEAAGIVKV